MTQYSALQCLQPSCSHMLKVFNSHEVSDAFPPSLHVGTGDLDLVWFCFLLLQWSNENQSDLVDAAGSLFRHALSILMPNGASSRQLPPSVAAIGPKSRVMFPLGMGHASEYIRHRVALIGYVHRSPS